MRNIPWNASPEQAKAIAAARGYRLDCRDTSCSARVYVAQVRGRLIYHFKDDKLRKAWLDFEPNGYSAVKNMFIELYGPPTESREERLRVKSDLPLTRQELRWERQEVVILLWEYVDVPGRLDRGFAMLIPKEEWDTEIKESAEKRSDRSKDKR